MATVFAQSGLTPLGARVPLAAQGRLGDDSVEAGQPASSTVTQRRGAHRLCGKDVIGLFTQKGG